MHNIPTNSNTQVVPPASAKYLRLRFSPDGNYLYFVRAETGSNSFHYLYRAPVLGSTPEKLVTDIDTNISFSPDGKKIVYTTANSPKVGEYRLTVHSLESGEEKQLATGPYNEILRDPAWSPNGKAIVCVIPHPGTAYSGLVAVDPETGKRNLFMTSDKLFFSRPRWLPEGKGMLVVGDPPYGAQDRSSSLPFPMETSLRSRETPTPTPISACLPMATPLLQFCGRCT